MDIDLLKQNLENIVHYLHQSDLDKCKENIKNLWLFFEYYDDLKKRSITWSVLDFQGRAEQNYGKAWKTTYNETKFPEALEMMINRHDRNIGLDWDDVDFYLDELCTFK